MIPSTSSRLRRLASGFAVAAAAVMLITSSATARPPDHSGPGASGGPAKHGSLLPPDQARTVTLITGNVVRVQGVRGGRPLVVVRPRPGRGNAIFAEFVTASGQIEVVPEDILPLLGRVLDPALFDVTTLIAHGDDDTHRSYLPLVVQGQAGRSAAAAVTAAGLTLRPPNRQSEAGPVAAREPRTGAARMGRVLAAMAAAVLRASRVTPSATRGIGHIWLAQTAQGRYGTETGAAAARATAAPSVRLTLKAIPIPGTAKGQMGAFAYVVNIGNPNLFDREVPINPAGGTAVRVPAGRYWVSGVISDDTNPNERRVAWAGRPELTVSKNTTVKLDGAAAVPVTASVPGHRTVMTTVGFHIERRFASKVFGGLAGGDVFAIGTNVAHDVFAQPTGTVRTGQFHVYTDFEARQPGGHGAALRVRPVPSRRRPSAPVAGLYCHPGRAGHVRPIRPAVLRRRREHGAGSVHPHRRDHGQRRHPLRERRGRQHSARRLDADRIPVHRVRNPLGRGGRTVADRPGPGSPLGHGATWAHPLRPGKPAHRGVGPAAVPARSLLRYHSGARMRSEPDGPVPRRDPRRDDRPARPA